MLLVSNLRTILWILGQYGNQDVSGVWIQTWNLFLALGAISRGAGE